jgi:hypothetical protein
MLFHCIQPLQAKETKGKHLFQCLTPFLVFTLQIDVEFCILIEVVRCLASRETVILVTAVFVHFFSLFAVLQFQI